MCKIIFAIFYESVFSNYCMGILILPENIANQIAAGEVIERPTSVVKELLENSLDAQASDIEIQFRAGGSTFIQITDNGTGMTADDAILCFKRHATSKLKTFDDLQTLHSFGFRGEAIPSIASISKVSLTTRHASASLGTHIEFYGGQLIKQTLCTCPIGTTFTVEQLFYNVPARRKFLKSEATESAHIINCVRLYATVYPHIHFKLVQDHRTLLSSQPHEDLKDRIHELWPKRNVKQWLTLDAKQENLSISGLISYPGEGVANGQEIYTFLNQRPIASTFLLGILRESYRGFLPPKTYPSAFLFLQIPENEVDINVHPTKHEIRLKHEILVKKFIHDSLQQCLNATGSEPLGITHTVPFKQNFLPPLSSVSNSNEWICKKEITHHNKAASSVNITCTHQNNIKPTYTPIAPLENKIEPKKECLKFKFFTLWQNQYALFDEYPFLLILNCKGAQKRIWYEHILKNLKQGEIGTLQTLLFPQIIELNELASACISESIDYLTLRKICILKPVKNCQFQLEAMPPWVPLAHTDLFIDQLIESLTHYGQNQSLEHLFEPLLQRILKQHTFPSIESQNQVENLYQELNHCPNYITEPNGNPLWKRLSLEEFFKNR